MPGGRPGKIIGSMVLILGVSALLLFIVFPWVEPMLPFNDITVE